MLTTVLVTPVMAEDPLVDLFSGRNYDKDAILRQFPQNKKAAPITLSAPDTSNNSKTPTFIPLQPLPAAATIPKLTLLLPTLASGINGIAARNFYHGCLHGLNIAGYDIPVELYAADNADILPHYEAAIKQNARFIIGPMLRKNVNQIIRRYPQPPVPTLLLQPAAATVNTADNKNYFVMTINAAQEAADLAALLSQFNDNREVLIVEQNSPRGRQQSKRFEQQWTTLNERIPERFIVSRPDTDWTRLFQQLKNSERESLIIFAAGNADFAANVRGFVPQQYSVFAISTINTSNQIEDTLSLEGLSFMEMPWFVGLTETQQIYDLASIRYLPIIHQRFFVLGADTCLATAQMPYWREGWTMRGLSGDWQLQQGIFYRRGILSAYMAGKLIPLAL